MDEHRSVSVSRVYVPNEYTLYLSPADRAQFAAYEGSLVGELQEYLAEHARREGYALLTPPRVLVETDDDLAMGEFGIATRVVAAEAAARSSAASRRPSSRLGATAPQTMIYRPRRLTRARPKVEAAAAATRAGGRDAHGRGRVPGHVGRGRRRPLARVRRPGRRRKRLAPALRVVEEGATTGRRRPRLDERHRGQRPTRVGRERLDDGDRITVGCTELVFGRALQ